jgi:hypothetical protein
MNILPVRAEIAFSNFILTLFNVKRGAIVERHLGMSAPLIDPGYPTSMPSRLFSSVILLSPVIMIYLSQKISSGEFSENQKMYYLVAQSNPAHFMIYTTVNLQILHIQCADAQAGG